MTSTFKISHEILSEIEETFACASNTNDISGSIKGSDIFKLCFALGLDLNPILTTYYKENDKERVYFETFKKIISECFDPADVNPHRTMDAEMTEVCGYLAADPDKSDIVDAFETKNWFIKIGESLDNDDVERQLALHCHTDKETVNEMSLEHFKIMVKGYSGAVQILED